MNKPDSFFKTLKGCISDLNYYQSLFNRSFWNSAKYLYILLFLTSFLIILKTTLTFLPNVPKINTAVANFKNTIPGWYPKELIVTVKNGTVQTNVQEPYYIELPNGDKKNTNLHLIAIDTKGNIEDFVKYKTIALITKSSFVTIDKEKNFKVYPIDQSMNFVLNKDVYDQFTGSYLPYFDYFPKIINVLIISFVILGPFLSASSGLTLRLLFGLITALIFFLFAKIRNKNLRYSQVYKLMIFASTAPILMSTLLYLLPQIEFGILNSFSSLVFIIIMIIVINKYQNPVDQTVDNRG